MGAGENTQGFREVHVRRKRRHVAAQHIHGQYGLGQLLVAGKGRHVFRHHASQVFAGRGSDEDGLGRVFNEHGGNGAEFVQGMHHGRILARYILKLYLGQGFVKGASGAEGQGIMVHGLGFGELGHSVGNQHSDNQGEHHLPGHGEFHHQHQRGDWGVRGCSEKGGHAHQGIGDGMVPGHPQLGKSRAEQEAADAPDSQAGGQGAPHGSHAEDDGDGEYFQEQQDGGSRGVKFIMNEGGDDIFAVPYDFRVKDGDGSHQHACRRQAHGQPLALAVQVPARFFEDEEPETGDQGGQGSQQHAPEHMLVARQRNFLLELVDGGGFMEQAHGKVPRAAGNQQGSQEINSQRAQNDFTYEQTARQGRMEGGGHAGGGGAGHYQAQARS